MGSVVKKIRYKQSPQAAPSSISLLQLKQLILENRLSPDAMIQDQSLTSGKWRNLDTLAFYHHIKLVNEYLYGDMIEKVYRLGSLQQLVDATGALAATRLYVLQSHQNERICTVQFFEQGNVIETAIGSSCLRDTFGDTSCENAGLPLQLEKPAVTFDPRDIQYQKTTIYQEQMPEMMHDWPTFQTYLQSAGHCSCDLPDCLECRHTSLDTATGSKQDVLWRNPLADIHPQQSRIIKAYFSITAEIMPDQQ